MISFIIVILLISYSFFTLYRTISKKKEGKCGSCHIEGSCSKTSCTVDWEQTLSEAFPKHK